MSTSIAMEFINAFLQRANWYNNTAHLTLTAIHPDRRHPVPSRHIPLTDNDALQDAVEKLLCANQQGYGAFVGIGLRKGNLGRWRRGGFADVLALPALFVDIDAPPDEALKRLNQRDPPPSCIVLSGYGLHAYWWLEEPITDLSLATCVLKHLRLQYGSDTVSIASSMCMLCGIVS